MYHDLSENRIELSAQTLDEFLSYDLLRNGVTVTPLGCHRIVSIGNCNDPCDLGNIIALKSFGITLAVVSFMV